MRATPTLILAFILIFGLTGHSQIINLQQAQTIASHFLDEQAINFSHLIDDQNFEIKRQFTFNENQLPWFYVFTLNNKGFVIVSAHKYIQPIIGYSYKGTFPDQFDRHTNYGSFLYSYVEALKFARQSKQAPDVFVLEAWDYYLCESFREKIKGLKREKEVEPLLQDIWNQNYPYNILCPEDQQGPGNHVYAGCVATSMSQIMYYWRFPETGHGSQGYSSDYGYLSANFGETTYAWNAMQNEIDNKNPWAIALLQYHAGISVMMDYSPSGSSALGYNAAYALENYFKYTDAVFLKRDDFFIDEWKTMLYEELDNKRPVAYYGNSFSAGHAFVCDGYQEDHFHFNFGWGGNSNGYYAINDINGFTYNQRMIRYLQPDQTAYPNYVNEALVLNHLSGSFTDGSGPVLPHAANIDASWLIDPQSGGDSISHLTLIFSEFDLGLNDELLIYDGASTSASLIGTYQGSTSPDTINPSGNQLFITFHTDGSSEGNGFYAEYQTESPTFCSGMTIIEEESGTFDDGSGMFHYGNNQTCFYEINTTEGKDIILDFNYFELDVNDLVKFYDQETEIITYHGGDTPERIVAHQGKLVVAFMTDALTTAQGWEASFYSSPIGIDEINANNTEIFPVPASKEINISSTIPFNNVKLINLSGRVILNETIQNTSFHVIRLSNVSNGLYFLRITGLNSVYNSKICISQ